LAVNLAGTVLLSVELGPCYRNWEQSYHFWEQGSFAGAAGWCHLVWTGWSSQT